VSEKQKIADSASSFITYKMLQSVLRPGGTAGNLTGAQNISNNLAAKTGTGEISDFWFVGFSKKISVLVWVGMPNHKPALTAKQGFSGATVAGPIWLDFMKVIKKKHPELLAGEFQIPANVTLLPVNTGNNCIAAFGNTEEYFISGRVPSLCKSY